MSDGLSFAALILSTAIGLLLMMGSDFSSWCAIGTAIVTGLNAFEKAFEFHNKGEQHTLAAKEFSGIARDMSMLLTASTIEEVGQKVGAVFERYVKAAKSAPTLVMGALAFECDETGELVFKLTTDLSLLAEREKESTITMIDSTQMDLLTDGTFISMGNADEVQPREPELPASLLSIDPQSPAVQEPAIDADDIDTVVMTPESAIKQELLPAAAAGELTSEEVNPLRSIDDTNTKTLGAQPEAADSSPARAAPTSPKSTKRKTRKKKKTATEDGLPSNVTMV